MIDWTYVYLTIAGTLAVALALICLVAGWNDRQMKSVPVYMIAATVLVMGLVWPLTVIWMAHGFVVEAWRKKGKQ